MLPWKIFEILHAVMAILAPFAHFSGKLCLNFLTLILSIGYLFPKYDAFCRTFSVMRALGVLLSKRTALVA